jgi:peptide deformylase
MNDKKYKIIQLPDERLRQKSTEIDPSSQQCGHIVKMMVDALRGEEIGVGLRLLSWDSTKEFL